MSVVVFCGPTLSAAEVSEQIDAVCLPPARHGDILRALNMVPRPRVIALIDGLFRTVPAVRHKEILWAMSKGVHVFGAASMGALRAAELTEYGMVGVGSIFSDYLSGRIEDDDEVAVEHGPAELGFMQLSDAMVDIRATLAAALRESIIGKQLADCSLSWAKERFYAHRNWADLVAYARSTGCDASEIEALEAWLPTGRINLKRHDALEMLVAIRDFIATDPPPFLPRYNFERTEVWELDYEAARALPRAVSNDAKTLLMQDILDELRLVPRDFASVQKEALTRMLLLREARRRRGDPEPEEKEQALKYWLREQGVSLRDALDQNRLVGEELDHFLNGEALIRSAASSFDAMAHNGIIDTLRSRGMLRPLVERAEAKQHALRAMGKEAATTQTGSIPPAALVGWFWRQTFPDEMQMIPVEALAVRLGFADTSDMTRALLREYLFSEYAREHDLPIRSSRLTWE
ncbi:TfuA-like protein [Microvirga solisilvae]|uniref:TfuA-like protein n=1 Tax=Microvirga solisilvae TaxID=2919498 RepID=UPI001FAF888B|nr:TfuA-like protein [Microvirga solisilvae]